MKTKFNSTIDLYSIFTNTSTYHFKRTYPNDFTNELQIIGLGKEITNDKLILDCFDKDSIKFQFFSTEKSNTFLTYLNEKQNDILEKDVLNLDTVLNYHFFKSDTNIWFCNKRKIFIRMNIKNDKLLNVELKKSDNNIFLYPSNLEEFLDLIEKYLSVPNFKK